MLPPPANVVTVSGTHGNATGETEAVAEPEREALAETLGLDEHEADDTDDADTDGVAVATAVTVLDRVTLGETLGEAVRDADRDADKDGDCAHALASSSAARIQRRAIAATGQARRSEEG